MKNNKLICVLLALLVCLTITVSVSAAETETVGLDLSLVPAKGTGEGLALVVKPGETFTVTVMLNTNPGIKFAVAQIPYDTASMKLVGAKALVEGVAVNTKVPGKAGVVIARDEDAALDPESYEAVTVTGAVAELTFQALDTKIDLYSRNEGVSLAVVKNSVVDANNKYGKVEVTTNAGFRVSVITDSHVCNEANLIRVNAKDATCAADGYTGDTVCPVCNKVFTTGESIPALGHVWDEGVVTTEATCEKAGVKTFTCATCGGTREDEIAALGHTYATETVLQAATCVEAGLENVKCSVCGDKTVRVIPALGNDGHKYVKVAAVAPTCTATGLTEGESCAVCGEVKVAQNVVAATGHSYDEGKITTQPTCGTMGVRTYTCSVCQSTKTEDTVPATGEHNWDAGVVTKEATEDAEGVRTYTCTVCKQTKTEAIAKIEPSNNTVLIVVIVVVVVLAGAGAAAYFVLQNKKKQN